MKNHQTFIAIVLTAFAMLAGPGLIAADVAASGPTVYLLLNEKDQDSGCQSLYSIYESSKTSLPKGIKTARLDVNDKKNEALFKKFDVRILPTVLFVNKNGKVTKKLVGEGPEIEKELKDAFQKSGELLGK